MKKIILSVAILATCITSCKKKSDDPAPTPTKTTTEYLTAHKWKFSNAVSNVAIDADDDANTPNTKDIWSQYDACMKDDEIVFDANGTGVSTDAGIVCNQTGLAIANFTWVLTLNKLVLTFTYDQGPGQDPVIFTENLTIGFINDNSLIFNVDDTDPNGVQYIETDTLIK